MASIIQRLHVYSGYVQEVCRNCYLYCFSFCIFIAFVRLKSHLHLLALFFSSPSGNTWDWASYPYGHSSYNGFDCRSKWLLERCHNTFHIIIFSTTRMIFAFMFDAQTLQSATNFSALPIASLILFAFTGLIRYFAVDNAFTCGLYA